MSEPGTHPSADAERAAFDQRQAANLYKLSFVAGLLGLDPGASAEEFHKRIEELKRGGKKEAVEDSSQLHLTA